MIEQIYIRYGVGPIWIMCNILYACMRAQNKPENSWLRVLTFLGGFPHSIVSFLAVDEGKERVYGVDIPRKK